MGILGEGICELLGLWRATTKKKKKIKFSIRNKIKCDGEGFNSDFIARILMEIEVFSFHFLAPPGEELLGGKQPIMGILGIWGVWGISHRSFPSLWNPRDEFSVFWKSSSRDTSHDPGEFHPNPSPPKSFCNSRTFQAQARLLLF